MNERIEKIKERLKNKTVIYKEDTLRDIANATRELENDKWPDCLAILYANAPTDISYLLDQLTASQAEVERLKEYEQKCHDCPMVCVKVQYLAAVEENERLRKRLNKMVRIIDKSEDMCDICVFGELDGGNEPCFSCTETGGDMCSFKYSDMPESEGNDGNLLRK